MYSSQGSKVINSGAQAYAKMGVESAVMSASPHHLITLLFDGARTAINMARHHMVNKEIVAKGNAISKAINIIDNGLKASLDAEIGGKDGAELVANLSALYDY
ncbi:flagellar export chaperone FliS, partial [Glaciimonas sp. CA11.2]